MLVYFKRIVFISILLISIIGNCQYEDSIKVLMQSDSLLLERVQELELNYKFSKSDFLQRLQEKDKKIDSLAEKQMILIVAIDSIEEQLWRLEDSLKESIIFYEILEQDFDDAQSQHKNSRIVLFLILLGMLLISSTIIAYLFVRERRANEVKFSSLRKYTYNQLEEAKDALGTQLKQRFKKLGRKNRKQVSKLHASLDSGSNEKVSKGKNRKANKDRKKK